MALIAGVFSRTPHRVKHDVTPEAERAAFDRKVAIQKRRLQIVDERLAAERRQ